MTHPKIKNAMDTFGLTEQEAMFMIAVGLGIISGDVFEEGEPQGEDLDRAVIAALDEQQDPNKADDGQV